MQISDVIGRGDIRTDCCRPELPGRYLANGRFGTVLAGFGLNAQPARQNAYPDEGRSVFCHMAHWGRFRFVSEMTQGETAADYLLPLLRVWWEREPERVCDYHQHQAFYRGTVLTRFTNEFGQKISVTAWMDMEDRDLACFRIQLSEGTCVIRLSAVTEFIPYAFLYRQKTRQSVVTEYTPQGWRLTICCEDTQNQQASSVFLSTNADVQPWDDGLRLHLRSGETEIRIRYGTQSPAVSIQTSLERTERVWAHMWERTGWISFPEKRTQQMFVRSAAYLLASYCDTGCGIQPTSGLSGNMFPFHFVQDMGYIAPALQMLGHTDIVKCWLEKFAGEIPQMKRYARHLWPGAEGIYPPWELPFGDMDDYHRPCVPVIYCYEPHNVGYLCRMAAETAEYLADPEWTQAVAHPLIRECAAFYRAFTYKGSDGFWHQKWDPCVGQDEAGGQNQTDYLCSLYSAKYCFGAMVRFGLDENGEYAQILADGLCFATLLSDRGTWHTCRGADDFGKQKHPVQLVGLTYMPTQDAPLLPELTAYTLRHEITAGAKTPYYEGWTLGQFLLAAANLGDAEGWREDWDQLRMADYTDPEWIQFYETSSQPEKSFYMATHGLVLQGLLRSCVNDYWNRIDVARCPIFWDGISFGGIRTRSGAQVTGQIDNGICSYEIHTSEQVIRGQMKL